MGENFVGQIMYGEVILNRTTNDQIMPRWGRGRGRGGGFTGRLSLDHSIKF